jgi:hypothetical protein
MRISAVLPAVALLLIAARCRGDEDTPQTACGSPEQCDRTAAANLVQDRDAAGKLVQDSALSVWPVTGGGRPVVLYVDLSQSMRGFLDPEFPTGEPIEYTHVIDILDARLSPTPVTGFGSSVRVIGRKASGTLANRDVYSDGNTQLEDVFSRVHADSQVASTHIVVGDGRRSNPISAIDQFMQMRDIAAEWIKRGGTFAVAASKAPFKPVAADPSGCRTEAEPADTSAAERAKCPLYAFAFIAPGEQTRVVAALAEVFEHIYVTPMPGVDDKLVHLRLASRSAAPAIRFEPRWVPTPKADIARVRGDSLVVQPLPAEITLTDTTSPAGRAAAAALHGQSLEARLFARPASLPPAPWKETAFGGLVRAGADPLHVAFVSYGPTNARWMYRIELVPAGPPVWLKDFDAANAHDARRTYGLGRLFERFQQPAGRPALRAYVVVN